LLFFSSPKSINSVDMTDAALTARYAAAELVGKLLNEIDLPSTSMSTFAC
jgi:hypothetical protein